MANKTPSWSDFHNAGRGPDLPLSDAARRQLVSGVLPSGEANGLDFAQQNTAINQPFPYPNDNTSEEFAFTSGTDRAMFPDQFDEDWWDASGVVKTYPPEEGALVDDNSESGVFHFNQLLSQFSNASQIIKQQIDDFTIFNPYVHHENLPAGQSSQKATPVLIPYVSTYQVSIDFDAYNGRRGFGG